MAWHYQTQQLSASPYSAQGYDALKEKFYFEDISPLSFYFTPEPGERSIPTIWFGNELLDDGGGPALAAYRYGRCPFES